MTGRLRRQLSLFAPEPMRAQLDAQRATLDPVQHGLIPPHVTLCREDELNALAPSEQAEDLAAAVASRLVDRVASHAARSLILVFGAAESFEGHGILLPCIDGEADFHSLRQQILAPVIGRDALRRPAAHLTLAHPRNPRAGGNSLAAARRLPSPLRLTFAHVQLIEQVGSSPWTVLANFPLDRAEASDV